MGEEKIFTEVIFPDLAKEEAVKLVETYNKVSNLLKLHSVKNTAFHSQKFFEKIFREFILFSKL